MDLAAGSIGFSEAEPVDACPRKLGKRELIRPVYVTDDGAESAEEKVKEGESEMHEELESRSVCTKNKCSDRNRSVHDLTFDLGECVSQGHSSKLMGKCTNMAQHGENSAFNIENEEEAVQVQQRRALTRPSEDEVRKHWATHLPFRDWCWVCVAGRAKDDPHRPRDSVEKTTMPEVHFDYCFLRNDAKGDYTPVLVGKERRSKSFIVHVVPFKGGDVEWVAGRIVKDLEMIGIRGDMMVRTDQEPALKAVMEQVAGLRKDVKTILEMAPVGDSKGNGFAERAVQSIEEMVRVVKIAFEARTKELLKVDHKIFSWMVQHAADLLNKFVVGVDGRTAYHRVRGRPFHGEMYEFGCAVWFRPVGKLQGGIIRPRWHNGWWIGKKFDSNEHFVMAESGKVFRTRCVRESGALIKMEDFNKLKCEPHNPTGALRNTEELPTARMTSIEIEEDKEAIKLAPRRMRITVEVVNKFGGTVGCQACRIVEREGVSRAGAPHSERCRKRIEELMSKDPAFAEKLKEVEDERDRFMGNWVEMHTRRDDAVRPVPDLHPRGTGQPVPEPDMVVDESVSREDDSEIPVANQNDPELGEAMDTEPAGAVPAPATPYVPWRGENTTSASSSSGQIQGGEGGSSSSSSGQQQQTQQQQQQQHTPHGQAEELGVQHKVRRIGEGQPRIGHTEKRPRRRTPPRPEEVEEDRPEKFSRAADEENVLTLNFDDPKLHDFILEGPRNIETILYDKRGEVVWKRKDNRSKEWKTLPGRQGHRWPHVDMMITKDADTGETMRKVKVTHLVEKIFTIAESKKQIEVDISEIFSPPRVTLVAKKRGLRGGYAADVNHIDPRTGRKWDLGSGGDKEAFQKMRAKCPSKLLIASPPCTAFSRLQTFNGGARPDQLREGRDLLRTAIEECRRQHVQGRWFIFEHPKLATSWKEKEVQELKNLPGVFEVDLDMCRFGLRSQDRHGEGAAMKSTKILTNMVAVTESLARRCEGGHRHVSLEDGRAKAAAIYTEEFCEAIVKAYEVQVLGSQERPIYNLEELHPEPMKIAEGDAQEMYGGIVDSVTGEILEPEAVKKGREYEMGVFHDRRVYHYVTAEKASADEEGIIIATRWVNSRKGDGVRCRFVGKEFADGDPRDDLFAGTPPLMAAKLLVSRAATSRRSTRSKRSLMIMDVSCAFLYAPIKRSVYIELPDEDPMKKLGYKGKLDKALYGTRDAPQAWAEELERALVELGFVASKLQPSVFWNREKDLRVVVHVDDLLVEGGLAELRWLRDMLKDKYKIKSAILEEDGELQYLGRSIRKTSQGIEWEADKKHVEILVREWDLIGCKPCHTPIEGDLLPVGDRPEMCREEAKKFRRAAARLTYLSQDRVDLGAAANLTSRCMATPRLGDDLLLRRIIQYLATRPRLATLYKWREESGVVKVFTDSDWASCPRTRRSTSGGVIGVNGHMVAQWSRLQGCVTLSSGEAELAAAIKGVCEGLSVKHLMEEWGDQVHLENYCDSSAARGVVHRKGVGKLKHLEVKHMWIQEREKANDFKMLRVPRLNNVADVLTHKVTRKDLDNTLAKLSVVSKSEPNLSSISELGPRGGTKVSSLCTLASLCFRTERKPQLIRGCLAQDVLLCCGCSGSHTSFEKTEKSPSTRACNTLNLLW